LDHGRYLYGQILLNEGSNKEAYRVLAGIDRGHPDFFFARYSMATAEIRAGKGGDAADILRQCLAVEPETAVEREIRDRCAVKLGMLYMENDSLCSEPARRAADVCAEVSQSSTCYPQARTVMAWASLRQEQWSACGKEALRLIRRARTPTGVSEGLLLLGVSLASTGAVDLASGILGVAEKMLGEDTGRGDGKSIDKELSRQVLDHGIVLDSIAALGNDVVMLAHARRTVRIRQRIGACRDRYDRDSALLVGIANRRDRLRNALGNADARVWLSKEIDYAIANVLNMQCDMNSADLK
jgi:hypothetical protein